MELIYLQYHRRWMLTARSHRYRAIRTVRWFATGVRPAAPVVIARGVYYRCGCKAAGDNIASKCPIHLKRIKSAQEKTAPKGGQLLG